MADLKKTIRGLECCTQADNRGYPKCERCPYADKKLGTCDAVQGLMNDALSLLKAQIPRVLTLEEAYEADVCWAEVKEIIRIAPVRITKKNGVGAWVCHRFLSCSESFSETDYGKYFRFWSARPTDEQRKAVKWND